MPMVRSSLHGCELCYAVPKIWIVCLERRACGFVISEIRNRHLKKTHGALFGRRYRVFVFVDNEFENLLTLQVQIFNFAP